MSMYPGANFYGIKKILMAYAQLPSWLPFPVAIQHGWQRVAHSFEADSKPPEIWVWSPRIAKSLEKFYPVNKIRVIGSFYCYAQRLRGNSIGKEEMSRKGSICIPPHSSHLAKSLYSVSDFAEKLMLLTEQYKPITIMLYYLDMTEEVVSKYEKYGFKVVTNGELYNDNFINNFIGNVEEKKYCIFSDLGSGVFFSMQSGLHPVHFDIESKITENSNPHLSSDYILQSKEFDHKLLLNLTESSIKDELGVSFILSRAEMRKLIIKNYFCYDFFITFNKALINKFSRLIQKFNIS